MVGRETSGIAGWFLTPKPGKRFRHKSAIFASTQMGQSCYLVAIFHS